MLPPHRSKTGQKVIPLNSAALEELQSRAAKASTSSPPVAARVRRSDCKSWSTLRAKLGLEDARLHDLRHSFASFAAEDGASLHMIGKALGHRQPSTTQRYAHLADDPLRAMAERVGQRFERADHSATDRPLSEPAG